MPFEYLTFWINAENQYTSLFNDLSLTIRSVSFQPSVGWYLITTDALRVNLGDDLSNDTYQKLSLTLKYMFENNLTPSIIDLRYKAGAALNYGK
jgi:cell division septal protein FtsQ